LSCGNQPGGAVEAKLKRFEDIVSPRPAEAILCPSHPVAPALQLCPEIEHQLQLRERRMKGWFIDRW
jgi:hypothetical protein